MIFVVLTLSFLGVARLDVSFVLAMLYLVIDITNVILGYCHSRHVCVVSLLRVIMGMVGDKNVIVERDKNVIVERDKNVIVEVTKFGDKIRFRWTILCLRQTHRQTHS